MASEKDASELLDAGERLYAPVEIAHILNLSPETVQRLCRTGRIEASKHGTQWRVAKKEVVRYIAHGPREVENKNDGKSN